MKPLKPIYLWLAIFFSASLYFYIAYFLKRSETTALLASWGLLFLGYFFLAFNKISSAQFWILIGAASIFRLIFLFSAPSLSDDYYRFLWDGGLQMYDINPYLYKPNQIIGSLPGEPWRFLLDNMNSPNYYSVYPPALQLIFGISSGLPKQDIFGGVLVLRIFILLSELATAFFLIKLLKQLKLFRNYIFLYLLNPLVIIELTGNLHFEATMLFGVISCIYFLTVKKPHWAGAFLAFSVSIKLIPALFVFLMLRKIGWKQRLIFSLCGALTFLLLALPYVSMALIENTSTSIGLYYNSFEFNAGLFYLVRWIGFRFIGYDLINITGKIFFLISFVGILLISLRKTASWTAFLFSMELILLVYYAFALIVHPWYVCSFVVLAIFTQHRFALLWSCLMAFSYVAYQHAEVQENLYLVATEYLAVGIVAYLELIRKKKILPIVY